MSFVATVHCYTEKVPLQIALARSTLSIASLCALHMLCQTPWFMLPLTNTIGWYSGMSIPLILTWDCVIGKTGLVGMLASLASASVLLKPEFPDFPRSRHCNVCTPALTLIISGIPLQSDGRIAMATSSWRLSLFCHWAPGFLLLVKLYCCGCSAQFHNNFHTPEGPSDTPVEPYTTS